MISITREETIPFVQDGVILQMKKFGISVTATQEEGQSVEELESELEEVFTRNLEKTLKNDDIYNKLKKQLNFLATEIKKEIPVKASKILNQAKGIK